MKSGMNFKHLCLLSILLTSACISAETQSISNIYIINTTPSSVYFYNVNRKMADAFVLIDKNPTNAVLEPQGRLLYILHDGIPRANQSPKELKLPKKTSSLSVIDVKSKQFLKKIQLGWYAANIVFANDSTLIIYGVGKPRRGDPKSDAEMGYITVINARTGNIIFSTARWRWIQGIAWTSDFSRIIVLGADQLKIGNYGIRPYNPKISIFDAKGNLLNEIFTPTRIKPHSEFFNMRFAFSKDQNWFYVYDQGGHFKDKMKSNNAVVMVVDLKTCELIKSHDLGSQTGLIIRNPYNGNVAILVNSPQKNEQYQVFRLNGSDIYSQGINFPVYYIASSNKPEGFFVFNNQKSIFLPDTIDSTFQTIGTMVPTYNDPLSGNIINSISLPKKGKIVLITSYFEFGIYNTMNQNLECTGDIGREGIRTLEITGMLLSDLTQLGIIPFFYEMRNYKPLLKNTQIRKDEEFIYLLELRSKDITIINTEDGSVVDKIPVGDDCRGITLTPDSRYLFALNNNRLKVIDTRTNKEYNKYIFGEDKGTIKDISFIDESGNLALLFEYTLQIWNIEEGKSITECKLGSKAEFLVCSVIQ